MKGKVFILLPPLLSLSLYNIYFKKGRDYILKCVCSGNKFISINLRAWIYWIKREREGERDTGNHSGTSINYDFLVLVNAVLYFIKNIEARYVSLFFFCTIANLLYCAGWLWGESFSVLSWERKMGGKNYRYLMLQQFFINKNYWIDTGFITFITISMDMPSFL